MQELSLLEVISNALTTLMSSQVFGLLIFEIIILIVALIFSKLIDKKMVRTTCIFTSLIVLVFYISNYVSTVVTFINNVSTRLMELIYFPTTLEFIGMLVVSFAIMIITLLNKKSTKLIKTINTVVPITISFILLGIIEYINTYNIEFDEFSVFSNEILSSLYQLGMGLFIAWLIGLVVYKVDKYVIHKAALVNEVDNTNDLTTVKVPDFNSTETDEDVEMPKLKEQI